MTLGTALGSKSEVLVQLSDQFWREILNISPRNDRSQLPLLANKILGFLYFSLSLIDAKFLNNMFASWTLKRIKELQLG